jgi:hypothetical protein
MDMRKLFAEVESREVALADLLSARRKATAEKAFLATESARLDRAIEAGMRKALAEADKASRKAESDLAAELHAEAMAATKASAKPATAKAEKAPAPVKATAGEHAKSALSAGELMVVSTSA